MNVKWFVIFLSVLSSFLFLGMIGDTNEKKQVSYTCAFCTCVLAMAIIALKIA